MPSENKKRTSCNNTRKLVIKKVKLNSEEVDSSSSDDESIQSSSETPLNCPGVDVEIKVNQSVQFAAEHVSDESNDSCVNVSTDTYTFSTDEETQGKRIKELLETTEQCGVVNFSIVSSDSEEEVLIQERVNNISPDSVDNQRFVPAIELTIDLLDVFAASLCMKVKIIDKSQIREKDHMNRNRYMTFTMLDNTGMIRVIVHDHFCDEIFTAIQVGRVYSLARICLAKDLYRQNLYHLSLSNNSEIVEIDDKSLSLCEEYFMLQTVKEINEMSNGRIVDFQGTIRAIGDIHEFYVANKTIRYCDVVMCDYMDKEIKVVFLDEHAIDSVFWRVENILTLKRVCVNFSRGKSCSIVDETCIVERNPELQYEASPGF